MPAGQPAASARAAGLPGVMPSAASYPRSQVQAAALLLLVAGVGLSATWVVEARLHGRPLGSVHLWVGLVAVLLGASFLCTLWVGDLRERRARRARTLAAGRTRRLGSMGEAAEFLRLTGRTVPDEVGRVLAGHDRPGLVAVGGSRVPRADRDPHLLLDWVDAGEPVELYALALLAAVPDGDVAAHLSGVDLLDPVLLRQRVVNIRAAS